MTQPEPAYKCSMCCSTKVRKTGYLPGGWKRFDYFLDRHILYCEQCGFGEISPMVSDVDLAEFYEDEYRKQGSPFYIDYPRLSTPVRPDCRTIAQILLGLQYCDWSSGDIFLDVGPGSGASFHFARQILTQPRCVAIEYASGAKRAYERLYSAESYNTFDELQRATQAKPKLVIASHSLEHFAHETLVIFLKEIRERLALGGVFVAEVPHVDLRCHLDLRDEDAPHLLFFSEASLRKLFERLGFDVLFTNSCGSLYEEKAGSIHETATPSKLSLGIRSIVKRIASASKLHLPIRLSDPNFFYGGNRDCLRIVCRAV